MNHQVAKTSVMPLYGQISIHSAGTVDLPAWITGEEHAIASEHALVIATRPDIEGDVTIVVSEGPDDGPGVLIFDSKLNCPDATLEVGSIIGSSLTQIALNRSGYTPIRVYVDVPGAAAHIEVVLERGAVAY